MREIKLKAADGTGEFSAFVYEPAARKEPAGAVVVIQEIFGVNDALRATCEEMAAQGFIAIAPDLFWRQEPGVNLTDKTEAEWQKAFALMNGFDQDKGVEDLKAALAGGAHAAGCERQGRDHRVLPRRPPGGDDGDPLGRGCERLLLRRRARGLVPEFENIEAPLVMHIAEEG